MNRFVHTISTLFQKNAPFLFSAVLFLPGCTPKVDINNITTPPSMKPEDEKYANVYKELDGRWEGQFKVFEDQSIAPKAANAYQPLTVDHIQKPSLRLTSTLDVEQLYVSETPYFQKVTIWDTYTNEQGEERVVESNGVNKVQNGQLWCVVRKPDETVIHEGEKDGDHVLVWQRSEQNPQKIERFRETVKRDTYEIIGYGYYEGDDTTKTPKYWFYGRYERQLE